MRVNPRILLNSIVLISSIFGLAGLTIAAIVGTDIIVGVSCALIFILGFTAAKFHNSI